MVNKRNNYQKMKRSNKLTKKYIVSQPNGTHILNWIRRKKRYDILETFGIITRKIQCRSFSKGGILELKRNYKGNSFKRDYKSEYVHAQRNGYLDELNAIGVTKIEHSKERILELKRNYKGNSFKRDYPIKYSHAQKHKYLPELNAIKNKS